jgi:hypothetical protein
MMSIIFSIKLLVKKYNLDFFILFYNLTVTIMREKDLIMIFHVNDIDQYQLATKALDIN